MQPTFEAVIYDMDGLMIDSEPYWRKAEIKIFATVGVHLTENDCAMLTGYRFDEVVDYWFHLFPWKNKTKQEIYSEVINEIETAITHSATPMKGVHTSLEYFKRKNLKLAVASSSPMPLIQATVQKLQIASYFDVLVSAEKEEYGKPHPAVFIRAADQLQVRAEQCIVIEDSFNGLLAAKAARMKCAVVPWPEEFENPKLAIADWKWRTLEEATQLL